ncbi:MAG: pacearchaeosortase [Nanoarchaeota archaeon]|nr:pacearchaeosortase [Nanoarchaeota archaeon]MBU1051688.1 pacearchaeosortase [Nanoarchaeota archaeon]MBU1988869.1 pacearchaeosortase [Nanoarchaeota archaeon]
MKDREAYVLFGRYFILLLLGLFNLKLFYLVFNSLTVQPVFWVLSLIHDNATLLEGNVIFFGGVYAQIISACIAGAAYYLLLILNLSTPMSIKKRIKSIGFILFTFLILNIARILIFAVIATSSGQEYFDLAHRLTWYFGSTFMVVAIWFFNVWLFKIKDIPVYTDIKNLYGEIVSGRRIKR